ncbi:glycosyl hydrolase family 8 [Ramlibacter algicola]|uniref:cellulase n=1 Tax=Ramlibacter algicola TaxID=2795217 RepID=A0A934Q0N0_9BURK|nr:glycosyl hydrolase family 8 [Ramlibacter algicola]MBK0392462.1 hypothetical protein [Ramlibacter algicola]
MRRRLFISSGSAVGVSAVLAACGGGGGGGSQAAAGESSVSSAVVPTPASAGAAIPPAAVSGPNRYPFGARLEAYRAGVMPNNVSNASMDETIKRSYDAWKAIAVVDVPTVSGGKAIRFGNSPDALAVSEGMGYGMLITVLMAGHDPQARAIFDGLLTTVRARPAYSIPHPVASKYLMDWKLTIDGSSSSSAGGGYNAMDGDLDIAMALLMADRQWGSDTGSWNYKQEGINTIEGMKAYNFMADGTSKGLATPDVSRTSDYMIGHFRAFAKATGDSWWSTTVIDRCYSLIDRMQTVFSPGVGMMPDFIVATDTAAPIPSPGFRGDFVDTEMHYFANAQRNPWRWGTDYVLSGDARWKNVLDKMMVFFERDTGGDPAKTATGYTLAGNAVSRPYPVWTPKGVVGPQLCGAMIGGEHQSYLNALWTYNAENFSTTYYDAELQLLPMIVASGNWWNP